MIKLHYIPPFCNYDEVKRDLFWFHKMVSSFLIVRQTYRMTNQIFGWLFFMTIMGEIPNVTFSVVFLYTRTEVGYQNTYMMGLFFQLILLIVASWGVQEVFIFYMDSSYILF